MGETTSKEISVNASVAKPLGKPPPGDKTLGIGTSIQFYSIKDGDGTKEGEKPEIFVVQDSSLAVSKQNIVNSKLP